MSWFKTHLTNEIGDEMVVTEHSDHYETRVNGKVIKTGPVSDGHGKPEEVHRRTAQGWSTDYSR